MKLNLGDDFRQAVFKISEGNPGAVSVIMQCYERDFLLGQVIVASLDEKGIYGSQIWMVYKDECGEDLDKFIAQIDNDAINKASVLKKFFGPTRDKK